MSFPQLVPTALQLGFPGRVLAIGALAHRAPRTLKLLGTHTTCITEMGRSILAGCSLSTALARAYLHPVLADLATVQGHFSSEHVDDISQISIRMNEKDAIHTAIAQGIKLAEGMAERDLTISDKSVVVSNNFQAAKKVARLISQAGYPLKAVKHAEDLGVSTSAGGRRVVHSGHKRCSKAKRRAARVGRLSRQNLRAAQIG